MSRARDNRRKEMKRARNEARVADGSATLDDIKYEAKVRRMIRSGELPRFHLAKDADGKLESSGKQGYLRFRENEKGEKEYVLTKRGYSFRQVSTFHALTKK
jgi:hypothetical protein